jgi:hypothetical protein
MIPPSIALPRALQPCARASLHRRKFSKLQPAAIVAKITSGRYVHPIPGKIFPPALKVRWFGSAPLFGREEIPAITRRLRSKLTFTRPPEAIRARAHLAPHIATKIRRRCGIAWSAKVSAPAIAWPTR